MTPAKSLTRIGVFYDGMHFKHVSDYYNYVHPRKKRISISGLHRFVRDEIAKREGVNRIYCRIVDAHYFRGRLRASTAQERNLLFNERKFEDVLMSEGVTTHFLPIQTSRGEKGMDVWFSLEAFELAIYKRYDVCVLITGDADYLPLVRKLNTLGTRIMLLAWDFQYVDQYEKTRETRTAQKLIDEVTYPIMMADVIDDRSNKDSVMVNSIFLPQSSTYHREVLEDQQKSKQTGKIVSIREGYGFIKPDSGASGNVFFHHSEVVNVDFNDLAIGDVVYYRVSKETPEDGKAPAVSEVQKQ